MAAGPAFARFHGAAFNSYLRSGSTNENASLFPLVPVEVHLLDDDGEIKRCSVRWYQINEMLGTKLRALMQRTQGRAQIRARPLFPGEAEVMWKTS